MSHWLFGGKIWLLIIQKCEYKGKEREKGEFFAILGKKTSFYKKGVGKEIYILDNIYPCYLETTHSRSLMVMTFSNGNWFIRRPPHSTEKESETYCRIHFLDLVMWKIVSVKIWHLSSLTYRDQNYPDSDYGSNPDYGSVLGIRITDPDQWWVED